MGNAHLFISTSTELVRIPVTSIVLIEAAGNYCDIYLHGGTVVTVTYQLGQIVTYITEKLPDYKHMFARVGKSLVVNANCVINIDLTAKSITLVDDKYIKQVRKASRDSLKQIKEQLEAREQLLEQRAQRMSI